MKRYLLAAVALSGMINIMGSDDIETLGGCPSSCTIESEYPLVCRHCGEMNNVLRQVVVQRQKTQDRSNSPRCPNSVTVVQDGGVQKPQGARTAKAAKIKSERDAAKNTQNTNE